MKPGNLPEGEGAKSCRFILGDKAKDGFITSSPGRGIFMFGETAFWQKS